jgi:hypothetical protein
MNSHSIFFALTSTMLITSVLVLPANNAEAQSGPSSADVSSYTGLHLAAQVGDLEQVQDLIAQSADLELVDGSGRTPLHVAAFASHERVVVELSAAGANMNALEHQAYDIVTIAAVANDIEMLEAALESGTSAGNVTSPYNGTALIAAAHLGHHEVVKLLISAGAPLDHVNNLHWTALVEAVILGDGGPDHVETVKALVRAGANRNLADPYGITPLQHARNLGYKEIIDLLSD